MISHPVFLIKTEILLNLLFIQNFLRNTIQNKNHIDKSEVLCYNFTDITVPKTTGGES